MSDDKPKSPFDSASNPLEALAAASALGVTVATQAMGFWLSVLSGVTAAARESHAPAPEAPRKPEPKAEAPKPRPSADVVPLKPKPVAEKPVAEAPAPEPVAEAKAAPEPVKAEPVVVSADVEPVKTAEPKPEPVAKVETPAALETAPVSVPKSTDAEVKKAAPKPAARKAAPKAAAKKIEAKLVSAPAPAAKPVAAPAAQLTPDLFSRPKAQDKPAQPDDLKLIKGIGPKLEVTLNGLGIWTHAQIAALEPAEVAWLDDYLGLSGRIVRDGWIEAAKAGGTND